MTEGEFRGRRWRRPARPDRENSVTDTPSTDSAAEPRYTPLRARHWALGVSFTDFGGWQMPVRHTFDGAEHHAVREAAVVFDISNIAEFPVQETVAAAYLDFVLAGRLSAMAVGKAKFSLLRAEYGGIIHDVIVYRLQDDDFL